MPLKSLFITIVKLLICGFMYYVGVVVGGMAASLLQLPPPSMPPGADSPTVMAYLLLGSPVLALALALLARGMTGAFVTRALILTFLMWIANTLNTQLEAAIFTTNASDFGFSLVSFFVASLLCGGAVAWLFPPAAPGGGFAAAWQKFFAQRSVVGWAWRLPLAAVAFMPIYFFFGLLVVPFIIEYYTQNMYGLQSPPLERLLLVLFVRSVLFLLACLPVLAVWQGTRRHLTLALGLALFVLVGFLGLFSAHWLPLSVRVPHSIEILADEFVYAWALTALLVKGGVAHQQVPRPVGRGAMA